METNKINKVAFFFDSRATFSYSNNIIKEFKKNKKKFSAIVSGNYLDPKFGIKKNFFKKNKIKINEKANFKSPNLNISSWSISMGKAIIKYAKILKKINPDILVLTGDRIETLAMCITASYMNIKIAHIQAGDISGHIDDLARAAIAKFSHLHFAPSNQACKRLLKWGEEKKRIFFTGAPQLNDISDIDLNFKDKDYFLIIFHPVLNEKKKLFFQIKNLINAIKKTKKRAYWIYSNNDMGHNIIINKLKKLKLKKIRTIKNLERKKFLAMLKKSKGLIGNSSSGIIEASMFKIPVINIGSRQNYRPQSKNIVNTNYSEKDIFSKIKFISNKKNLKKLTSEIKNPFFKKTSSKEIFKLIFKYRKNNSIFKKY